MQTSKYIKEETPQMTFLIGNAVELSCRQLALSAPYGKVLILSTLKSFFSKGKELNEKIKLQGGKPLNFIADENFSLTVDGACGLFVFPEDVRAVVATDGRLFSLASYLASLKGWRCIYLLDGEIVSGTFSFNLPIVNGGVVDFFKADEERTVIIDEETLFSQKFYQSFFVRAIEYAVKAVDKIILHHLTGKAFDVKGAELLDSLFNALILNNGNSLCFTEKMIKIFLELEKLYSNEGYLSALDISKLIYTGGFVCVPELSVEIGCRLLKEYLRAFTEGNGLNIPDYRARTEKLVALGYDENKILAGLYSQAKIFDCATLANSKRLRMLLKKSFLTVQRLKHKLPEITLSEQKRLEQSIIQSGDLPFSTNGMSAVRELGL